MVRLTVNPPTSKCRCIDILIVEGAGVTCTGFCPGIRINTHFQAHFVNLSSGTVNSVWKLMVIRDDLASDIVSPEDLVGPTILVGKKNVIRLLIPTLTNRSLYTVNVDIFVAYIFETEADNFFSCCQEDRLADVTPKRLFRFVSQEFLLHRSRRYSIYRSMN